MSKTLNLISKEVSECTKCSLAVDRNQPVFGTGSVNADLMFIGEGPGAEEDRLGIPFVGPQYPNGKKAMVPPKELPKDSLNVPTYRSSINKPESATRQLDYVFASDIIHNRMKVRALNKVEEWGLSDHCRILIEIE